MEPAMLIEFRVENHRSLRDEQMLTMEAGRVGDGTDPRPRRVPGHPEPLLSVAVLYGANASGKSNVLAALEFMRHSVLFSHSSWSPDKGVPREPFAWGPKRAEPSLFEVTLLLEGIRYQYGFVASDECFLEEWLRVWPSGKKQVWLEREGNKFKFGDNLKGQNKLIEDVTRPNALFLSAAVQHRHEQLQPIFSWFGALRVRKPSSLPYSRQRLGDFVATARILEDDDFDSRQLPLFSGEELIERPLSDQLLALLRNADVGIVDVKVKENKSEAHRYPRPPRFYFRHRSKSDDAWLPLSEESRGTQALFSMALPIVLAIGGGNTLVVDELDASLHPSLALEIVRQFNDPATNPHNAQIIFSTHDTNLLGTTVGEPALRRDQVWLTEKDSEGATVLYPLTDYKPRKAENIERGYLQGRYGAIPFLGDFRLLGIDSP
jgi:AAA15 family ATPase/GTPase